MKNKVYTTREVGNFCGVDLTTVINWVNQGRLKAYKTAGGHRRIKLEDLKKFMNEFSMPFPPEFQDRNGFKVLVITEDNEIQDIITQSFKEFYKNFRIRIAADAFEAGNKLTVFKPDIVILSLTLPGIVGYKLVRKIKKIENDVKIIAITANENNKIREKVLNAGSDGYIVRPFTKDDFLSAVKKILG